MRLIHHSSLPHLVLSDLMMPVMDGHQLLEKLKSDDATRHIPVIMLTARVDVRDKLRALSIGVDDYLLKPFDEEELLVRIENLLKNQAARRSVAITEVEPEARLLLESR
jgi:DNA-binding response OmpR family regulator